MRIGLDDMDNRIAEELKQHLVAPPNELFWASFWFPLSATWLRKWKRPKEERHLVEFVRKHEAAFLWRVEATVAIPALLGLVLFVGLIVSEVAFSLAAFAGFFAWATTASFGAWRTTRLHPVRQLRRRVSLEEMRAVFPLLRLSRAERIYCDALEMLARTEADETTAASMRDALRQLSDLLKNSRALETRRGNLLAIQGLNVIPELEAEFGELGRKLDKTTDTISRQAMQQSLQMCAARLENARNMTQGMERLNAQQEAIVQTLATTLSAMARLQAAPDVQAEAAAQEIAATVAQMNQQTYAVEQAVEEVITLRGS